MTSKWPSVWVKISSSWICISLYVWTLVAPLVLTNRDFDWRGRRKKALSKPRPSSLWIPACKRRASWSVIVNSWSWRIPGWLILSFGWTVACTVVIFICAVCYKMVKTVWLAFKVQDYLCIHPEERWVVFGKHCKIMILSSLGLTVPLKPSP